MSMTTGICARLLACVAALATGSAQIAAAPLAGTSMTYRGTCDASAVVMLDDTHFVIGDDETDTLRIYRLDAPQAVTRVDLRFFLHGESRVETDIEAAAAIGSRIWWIGSHSRNARGELQTSRQRLFATDIVAGDPPTVVPVGTPYRDLLRDLTEARALAPWGLAAAAQRAAEAEGGLNIEGLAATPDGRLLLGFRNPVREGRALVVPIDNPEGLLAGERARLGAPIALDLGGRGIRSLDLVGMHYYIVAGPIADVGTFALYRWSGRAEDAAVMVDVDMGTLRPEALFPVPQTSSLVLVSDDGGVNVGGRECKRLPHAAQRFRTLRITP